MTDRTQTPHRKSDIADQRLHNQQLAQTRLHTPEDVVAWLGAVQAQDYAGAKWALGLRMPNATDDVIEQALNAGLILRTHVMRPTWHFVAPADIRWLLALTAPRVHAANATYYRKLQLDDALFLRANTVIAKALEGGKQCTRSELASALAQAGINEEGMRLGYLIMRAELDGIVCSGARRGKQFTYALLDERVPPAKTLERDEALAELTRRYFTSHGPATVQDFAWWSGLTQADVKAGLVLAETQLVQEVMDGTPYWHAGSPATEGGVPATALLLPAYDEYTVAYKDRSAILDPQVARQVGSAVIDRVFVHDGQALGNWKRSFDKGTVVIESAPFGPWRAAQQDAFAAAAQRYGAFLNMPIVLA